MTRPLALLLTLASATAILGAWGFQYILDIPPCALCFYQRYPHWVAMSAGLLFLKFGGRVFAYLGALGALATSLVGFYHSGVERKWWAGPSTCTSQDITGMSTDELMAQIMSAPLVRCDEIPWDIFGVSMANLNAIGSLGLAAIWVWVARKS